MSAGFGGEKLKDGKAVVVIDENEVDRLLKKYKKIKKYDGTESYVSELIKEAEENPIE
jgi:hypothetical protein